MIVRIIGLVLFIIRIRFPRGKSIADIIRNRYGEAFVKKIRRFEKCDFKLRKCHLDLRFLLDCKKTVLFQSFSVLNQRIDTLIILMCTGSANLDCQKRKPNQSERGLILWRMSHRRSRKNYKEHFLFEILLSV